MTAASATAPAAAAHSAASLALFDGGGLPLFNGGGVADAPCVADVPSVNFSSFCETTGAVGAVDFCVDPDTPIFII